jgi:hypothetical protein
MVAFITFRDGREGPSRAELILAPVTQYDGLTADVDIHTLQTHESLRECAQPNVLA